jgi:hypothetical protein
VPVPVIDSVVAGTEVLLALAREAHRSPPPSRSAASWSGLSPELLASLNGPAARTPSR